MRKYILILLALLLVLLSSCTPKKEDLTGEVTVPKPYTENTLGGTLKLTKLDSNFPVTLDNINNIGFKKAVLETEGLREDSGNYKTNFKRKNSMLRHINVFQAEHIPYYIELTSGPGISKDRTNTSLYNNKNDVIFFSQMVRETIEINKSNKYFNGIILNIAQKDINEKVYYETLKEITDRILKDYNYPIFITLDGNILNDKDSKLPDDIFTNELVGYNIDMSIECTSYPGKGTINGVENNISKNSILDKLVNIKESEEKDRKFMVSYKSRWNNDCDVFMKDIFEIMKILGFEFNLSYSNTNNEYDFTNHKGIINIIQKF